MKIKNWDKLNNIILDISDDIFFELRNAQMVSDDIYMIDAVNDASTIGELNIKLHDNLIIIHAKLNKKYIKQFVIVDNDLTSLNMFCFFLKNCISDYIASIIPKNSKMTLFTSLYNDDTNDSAMYLKSITDEFKATDLW